MDLPEIHLEVVKYLEGKDLFACILVNRAWNDTFLPSLYYSLKIQINDWADAQGVVPKVPSVDVLWRFGHLIQELEIDMVNNDPPSHPFTIKNVQESLSALEDSMSKTSILTATPTAAAGMTTTSTGGALFPNVRNLTLGLGPKYGLCETMDWIAQCPNIQHLCLNNPICHLENLCKRTVRL